MSYFDVTNDVHVPEVMRMSRRDVHRPSAIRAILQDVSRLIVRPGAIADLPDDIGEHERQASVHAARAIDASRRTGAHHALSHSTAALLHGLPLWTQPTLPEITSPVHTSAQSDRDVVRHTMPLPDEDVVELHGVPVTSRDRTVIDLARFFPPMEALLAADRLMSWNSEVDRFDRTATERRARKVRSRWYARLDALPLRARGIRTARAVVEWAVPWSESARESWLRWVILTWGRRDVVAQCPIDTPDGVFFTDLALPDGVLADGSRRWACNEYDGGEKLAHDTATVLREQERRERAITGAGHGMLRFDRDTGISSVHAVGRITASLTDPLAEREPVLDLIARPSQLARTRWKAVDPIPVGRVE